MALIRDSSAVERLLVKQRDVSSNLTLGAKRFELFPVRGVNGAPQKAQRSKENCNEFDAKTGPTAECLV